MAFEEDLSMFFDDFAEDGTLAGLPVRVIFDAPVDQALAEYCGGATASQPVIRLVSASVPASVEGLAFVSARGSFTVLQQSADGTGISELKLQRA